MLHGVQGSGVIMQWWWFLEPVHDWWMVFFSIDRYVRGNLVLFAEYYVVFTKIAVISEDGNFSITPGKTEVKNSRT